MVSSRLIQTLNYPKRYSINTEDINKKMDLYLIDTLSNKIVVAIGTPQQNDAYNIIYWPIYLLRSNDKFIQIGLFEAFYDEDNPTYLDGNGDLVIENLNKPLFYFSPDTINKLCKVYDDVMLSSLSSLESALPNGGSHVLSLSEDRKDTFTVTPGTPLPKLLKQESYDVSKDISDKYHEQPNDNWIQKFMKNNYYSLVDNKNNNSSEKGNDCFFGTIRDAFSTIGHHTSIDKLRKKLSSAMTEQLFLEYKENYETFKRQVLIDTKKLKELTAQHEQLKNIHQSTTDRQKQQELIKAAKEMIEKHALLKNEILLTKQILQEFKFMEKVEDLDEMKQKIQSCDFWTETSWMLSTLERLINVKLIILSHEAYKKKDTDNVLDCGKLNDSVLKTKGIFTPDFYIILERDAKNTYQLVKYKGKSIFQFTEIPYGLKKLIIDKCMENNSGIFSLIPDFENLKASSAKNDFITNDYDDLNAAKISGLYDGNATFRFYEKSDSKPLPGRGSGEDISKFGLSEFIELAKYPDWRKKLDDSWVQPFTLNNHQWSSVEHYYQASKFKNNNPAFYLSFSLDSNTELSKNVNMAKAAGGPSGKYKGELLRPKQVIIDKDFYDGRNKKELYDAQYAKFSQNDQHDLNKNLKNLLLATKKAKLTAHRTGKPVKICDELMFVRKKLQNESK